MTRASYYCRIDHNGCPSCKAEDFGQTPILSDSLALAWELTDQERRMFDEREGHSCLICGMSKRVRMLYWSLKKLLPELQRLDILHLNRINGLSGPLREARILVETVYRPDLPFGTLVEGYVNQDMTDLKFTNCSFDVVIHSETLEHIHDYEKALSEATRVLRPEGRQLYTVPLLHNRLTRRRMIVGTNGERIDLLPPSFHGNVGEYPVVWEFGGDFFQKRGAYIAQIHYDDYWSNPTIFTIIENKS